MIDVIATMPIKINCQKLAQHHIVNKIVISSESSILAKHFFI